MKLGCRSMLSRLLVHKALSSCFAHRLRRSISIFNFTIIPTKREFIYVAMEMLLTDVVKSPDDSTFQKGEIAFSRIHVIGSASVFQHPVADGPLSTVKLITDSYVAFEF